MYVIMTINMPTCICASSNAKVMDHSTCFLFPSVLLLASSGLLGGGRCESPCCESLGGAVA